MTWKIQYIGVKKIYLFQIVNIIVLFADKTAKNKRVRCGLCMLFVEFGLNASSWEISHHQLKVFTQCADVYYTLHFYSFSSFKIQNCSICIHSDSLSVFNYEERLFVLSVL